MSVMQESWRKEIEGHLERLRIDGFGAPRALEDEGLVEQREEELKYVYSWAHIMIT